MVQLSHLYMTTGKTIAVTIQTFVGQIMSLLFNMLSRFVIAFFPRRKCLLISWLWSPSAVNFEPKKIKYVTVSIVPPFIFHEAMGLDAMMFMLVLIFLTGLSKVYLASYFQESLYGFIYQSILFGGIDFSNFKNF